MRIFMGVDGGGSKTHTVVVNEKGAVLGSGLSGCGNHQGPGIDIALSHIKESINEALNQAKLTPADIDFIQFGLAGADREKDFSILRPALATLGFRDWELVCDTMEGLRTGSRDNVGVVLVCGSGTNAAGRNPQGQVIQTGGFGYLYGDAAGGSHIALETFRAAVRSWELREIPSILTDKVPAFLQFNSMQEMFDKFLDTDTVRVPRDLTKVLHQAADEGDELANRLLQTTGRELGIAAVSVIRRLGGFSQMTIPIVLVGSVLQKGRNKHLMEGLTAALAAELRHFELVVPQMAPVYGSVMLAMDRFGVKVTKDMEDQFVSYGGYSE